MSVMILLLVVGFVGWAWGKTQIQAGGSGQGGTGGAPKAHMPGHSAGGPTPGHTPGFTPGPTPGYTPGPGFTPGPNTGFTPGPGFTPGYTPPPDPRQPPKPTWQRSNPSSANGTAREKLEKAVQERKKKDEELKKAEELRKKREEDEKERVKQREKDAREREVREAREKREKERAQERAKERAQERTQENTQDRARPASPTKGHRHPTAKTATEDDAYSYRPYDEPRRSAKTATASSIYSESSYAPSQSTSRTTPPPPSHRGPYRSKDPDKIVLKAVYSFNNTFTKVPISKLVSGVGAVTDGLILRVTTEGLFIDDDVRGVPQREWDVKAWTLKLVEVWCPHLHALGASSGSNPASRNAPTGYSGLFGKKWASKAPTAEESDSFLEASSRACKPYMSGTSGASLSSTRTKSDDDVSSQSGEFKGLHVLRASIRDQEGKRYVFILHEEEGWKVAVGLQRLRRGSQARALGVSGMAVNETKAILENMGWT